MLNKRIKYISLFIIAIVYLSNPLHTNAQAFYEKSVLISAGYGFVAITPLATNSDLDYTSNTTTYIGPFYLKFEKAVDNHIGFGVNISYIKYTELYPSYSTNNGTISSLSIQKFYSFSILARMNIHFGKSQKFDPYIGLGLGYVDDKETDEAPGIYSYASSGVRLNPLPLGAELTIGARYFLTSRLALYAEMGAAKSIFQTGLVVKLK